MSTKLVGMVKEKKALELAVKCNLPSLLIGDTGVGKTYLIRALAQEKGKRLVRINLNGETGISELVGKWLLHDGTTTIWQNGVLLDAITHGAWVVLDEINAALPEVLFVLNSLLDDDRAMVVCEKNNEVVKIHPETRIFATCNPADDYVGVKELNKALMSRFGIVVHVLNPEPDMELSILQTQAPGLHKDEGKVLVDIANILRKAKDEEKIGYICSTRDLVQCSQVFCADGMSLQEAVVYSIVGKAHKDDRDIIIAEIEANLHLKIPTNCQRGEVPMLLEDFTKTIKELEDERNRLKFKADNLENEVKKAIDSVKKGNAESAKQQAEEKPF